VHHAGPLRCRWPHPGGGGSGPTVPGGVFTVALVLRGARGRVAHHLVRGGRGARRPSGRRGDRARTPSPTRPPRWSRCRAGTRRRGRHLDGPRDTGWSLTHRGWVRWGCAAAIRRRGRRTAGRQCGGGTERGATPPGSGRSGAGSPLHRRVGVPVLVDDDGQGAGVGPGRGGGLVVPEPQGAGVELISGPARGARSVAAWAQPGDHLTWCPNHDCSCSCSCGCAVGACCGPTMTGGTEEHLKPSPGLQLITRFTGHGGLHEPSRCCCGPRRGCGGVDGVAIGWSAHRGRCGLPAGGADHRCRGG